MLQRTGQASDLSHDGKEARWTSGALSRRLDLVDVYAFIKSNRRIIAGWTIAA